MFPLKVMVHAKTRGTPDASQAQKNQEKTGKQNMRLRSGSQLEELIEKLDAEKRIEEKDGKIYIDLEKFGYTKLLGMGKINKPLIVKIRAFSASAAEKIEAAGGQILKENTKIN